MAGVWVMPWLVPAVRVFPRSRIRRASPTVWWLHLIASAAPTPLPEGRTDALRFPGVRCYAHSCYSVLFLLASNRVCHKRRSWPAPAGMRLFAPGEPVARSQQADCKNGLSPDRQAVQPEASPSGVNWSTCFSKCLHSVPGSYLHPSATCVSSSGRLILIEDIRVGSGVARRH